MRIINALILLISSLSMASYADVVDKYKDKIIAKFKKDNSESLCMRGTDVVTVRSYSGKFCADNEIAQLAAERCGHRPDFQRSKCYSIMPQNIKNIVDKNLLDAFEKFHNSIKNKSYFMKKLAILSSDYSFKQYKELKKKLKNKLINSENTIIINSKEVVLEKDTNNEKPIINSEEVLLENEKLILDAVNKIDLKTEGLFRISGDSLVIQKLLSNFKYNKLSESDLISENENHEHNIATLYKRVLAFRRDQGKFFSPKDVIDLLDKNSSVIEVFKNILKNKNTEDKLRIVNLLKLLVAVQKHEDSNKMKAKNLALMIAPNIFPEFTSNLLDPIQASLKVSNKNIEYGAILEKIINFAVEHHNDNIFKIKESK
jgi:hypothetical protein